MIAGHCARSDSSQFLLPFQGSVLQNGDHVTCEYAHSVLYWSLAHNCRENQNNCIILLATQAQCAELLKWPTYICIYGITFFIDRFWCLDCSLRLLHTRSLNMYSWWSCVLSRVQLCSYFRAGCYIHVGSFRINEALTSV